MRLGPAALQLMRAAAGRVPGMFADRMMLEANEHGGKLVGTATTLGFAVAFAIHTLD